MRKRFVACILAIVLFMSYFSNIHAFADQGGAETEFAAGFWDIDLCGLRFSLADKYGKVTDIVDIVQTNSFYSEAVLYNQCKITVNQTGCKSNFCSYIPQTASIYTTNSGEVYNWHYKRKDNLYFKYDHIDTGDLALVGLKGYHNSSEGTLNIKYNYASSDLKDMIIGKNSGDSRFFCAVLGELGIELDDTSNQTLRRDLITKFIIPEYSLIVEPVYYENVPMYQYVGGGLQHIKTVTFYGSATELGLGGGDLSPYDSYYFVVSGSVPVRMSDKLKNSAFYITPVVRNLALKSAYVGDEHRDVLDKFGFAPVADTDWDYLQWNSTVPLPEGVTNIDPRTYYTCDRDGAGNITYLYYHYDFIRSHACGMAVITASDFINTRVEAFDYCYNTSSDVVTSVKVSNRSDASYVSALPPEEINENTAVNENGVPYAMLGHFYIDRIETESGEIPVRAADDSFVDLSVVAPELGIEKCEYYGALDGILGKNVVAANGYADSYLNFSWKTPAKPCRITFRVEFMNANSVPEAVLGTAPENSTKLKGVKHAFNEERELNGTEIYSQDGSFFTTFVCEIGDGFEKDIAEKKAPDTVAITSVAYSSTLSLEEQKLQEKNIQIRDNYNFALDHSVGYYKPDLEDKTPVTSLGWTEYKADYSGSDITLTPVVQRVEVQLRNDLNEHFPERNGKLIRTDQNGLYTAYSDDIGSGYGLGVDFYSYFTNDNRGYGLDYVRNFSVNGTAYSTSLVTNFTHGAVLFPEFLYKDYYGVIEPLTVEIPTGETMLTRYRLEKNADSVYYESDEYGEKSRVHFIPTWFPDGEYRIAVSMFDAWTPAGQLWFCNDYTINIKGSIYDTWFASRTQKNQKRS